MTTIGTYVPIPTTIQVTAADLLTMALESGCHPTYLDGGAVLRVGGITYEWRADAADVVQQQREGGAA